MSEPTAESFAEQFGEKPVCDVDVATCEYQFPDEHPEPTYTMQQAIDRIVDGLVLEWVDYGELVRVENNWLGYFTVRSDKIIRPTGVTVEYAWGFRAHDGRDTPERPRYVRGKCKSFESGKAACLELYRARFRAEIEKAVARGS